MRTRIPLGTGALICGALVALLYYVAIGLQHGGLATVDSWAAFIQGDFKAEPYKGWSLADDEFADMDQQNARIVFYIMIAGWKELAGLDAIFETLYHTEHLFLLHMDVQAHENARNQLERRISQVLRQYGNGRENIRLINPSMPVTWGGFTMTLSAVYGLAQALHWTSKWDYFISLSASDLPLVTADEMSHILGGHKAHNTSFITGFLYHPSWEGFTFVDRREMFAEDASLMSLDNREKKWPWAILDKDKNMLTRPLPDLFDVYKGEFWVMLHRNMALYIHKSPDNMARMLLGYFSGMMVSDEEFFQTVACNPHFPRDALKTHNDNLRFVNWWGGGASPSVITPERAVAAANSGAIFGRKFSSMTEEGRDGVAWIRNYLENPSRSKARVDRVKRRLAERMGPGGEPQSFCGKKQERNPTEAYFATEGEEERLPGA